MLATSDWEFLCAAHSNSLFVKSKPRKCTALDYTCHTLTHFNHLIAHTKIDQLMSRLSSMFRRLYRIFAHSYFHHRIIFIQNEINLNTFKIFKLFVLKFKIATEEQLVPEISLTEIVSEIAAFKAKEMTLQSKISSNDSSNSNPELSNELQISTET